VETNALISAAVTNARASLGNGTNVKLVKTYDLASQFWSENTDGSHFRGPNVLRGVVDTVAAATAAAVAALSGTVPLDPPPAATTPSPAATPGSPAPLSPNVFPAANPSGSKAADTPAYTVAGNTPANASYTLDSPNRQCNATFNSSEDVAPAFNGTAACAAREAPALAAVVALSCLPLLLLEVGLVQVDVSLPTA
jgi:hypothetical protein